MVDMVRILSTLGGWDDKQAMFSRSQWKIKKYIC